MFAGVIAPQLSSDELCSTFYASPDSQLYHLTTYSHHIACGERISNSQCRPSFPLSYRYMANNKVSTVVRIVIKWMKSEIKRELQIEWREMWDNTWMQTKTNAYHSQVINRCRRKALSNYWAVELFSSSVPMRCDLSSLQPLQSLHWALCTSLANGPSKWKRNEIIVHYWHYKRY